MKHKITQLFVLLLVLWLFCSMIVGIAWLFDCEPKNLYFVWEKISIILSVSFLFNLLFGVPIKFK